MRRYDRLALRVQSLNSGDQPAEDGLVFLFAPAATPKPIQKKLFDAIAEAMKDPATVQAMTQGRMEAAVIGLDDFATYVKTETKWWTDQIKAAGIEPE